MAANIRSGNSDCPVQVLYNAQNRIHGGTGDISDCPVQDL